MIWIVGVGMVLMDTIETTGRGRGEGGEVDGFM